MCLYNYYKISGAPDGKASDALDDSGIISASKPIPASAILTFVPDNEVNKIVTRPEVDNSSSPDVEKQMLLRDRRAAVQDSPYSRRRPAALLGESKTGGVDQSGEEASKNRKNETTEENVDGPLCTSSLANAEAVLNPKLKDDHPPKVTLTDRGSSEASTPAAETVKESKMPVASSMAGETGKESKIRSVGETGKDTKIPAASTTVEQTKSASVSKDDTLSSKKSGDEPGLEVQPLLVKNQTVQDKTSVIDNKVSTQASSTLNINAIKSEVSSSVLANSSMGKPVAVSFSGGASHAKQNIMVTSGTSAVVTTSKQEVEGPVFRLGSEGNYSTYINQFTSNTLALTKQQHMDQRDKKRSVTNKFSLNEFKWHGDGCGSKEVILNTLRFSIVGLENSVDRKSVV